MAHFVDLDRPCQVCGRRASVQVFNSCNASQGVFCRTCGKRRLAELERGERPLNVTKTGG